MKYLTFFRKKCNYFFVQVEICIITVIFKYI